jgi:hypothetical protein
MGAPRLGLSVGFDESVYGRTLVIKHKCVICELWMVTLHPHPLPLFCMPPRHYAQSHG